MPLDDPAPAVHWWLPGIACPADFPEDFTGDPDAVTCPACAAYVTARRGRPPARSRPLELARHNHPDTTLYTPATCLLCAWHRARIDVN